MAKARREGAFTIQEEGPATISSNEPARIGSRAGGMILGDDESDDNDGDGKPMGLSNENLHAAKITDDEEEDKQRDSMATTTAATTIGRDSVASVEGSMRSSTSRSKGSNHSLMSSRKIMVSHLPRHSRRHKNSKETTWLRDTLSLTSSTHSDYRTRISLESDEELHDSYGDFGISSHHMHSSHRGDGARKASGHSHHNRRASSPAFFNSFEVTGPTMPKLFPKAAAGPLPAIASSMSSQSDVSSSTGNLKEDTDKEESCEDGCSGCMLAEEEDHEEEDNKAPIQWVTATIQVNEEEELPPPPPRDSPRSSRTDRWGNDKHSSLDVTRGNRLERSAPTPRYHQSGSGRREENPPSPQGYPPRGQERSHRPSRNPSPPRYNESPRGGGPRYPPRDRYPPRERSPGRYTPRDRSPDQFPPRDRSPDRYLSTDRSPNRRPPPPPQRDGHQGGEGDRTPDRYPPRDRSPDHRPPPPQRDGDERSFYSQRGERDRSPDRYPPRDRSPDHHPHPPQRDGDQRSFYSRRGEGDRSPGCYPPGDRSPDCLPPPPPRGGDGRSLYSRRGEGDRSPDLYPPRDRSPSRRPPPPPRGGEERSRRPEVGGSGDDRSVYSRRREEPEERSRRPEVGGPGDDRSVYSRRREDPYEADYERRRYEPDPYYDSPRGPRDDRRLPRQDDYGRGHSEVRVRSSHRGPPPVDDPYYHERSPYYTEEEPYHRGRGDGRSRRYYSGGFPRDDPAYDDYPGPRPFEDRPGGRPYSQDRPLPRDDPYNVRLSRRPPPPPPPPREPVNSSPSDARYRGPPPIIQDKKISRESDQDMLDEKLKANGMMGRGSGGAKDEPVQVEISPGVRVPLRRTQETLQAIAVDFYQEVCCLSCSMDVFSIADVSFVLCPECRVISPVTDRYFEGREVQRHGLGLGFSCESLFKMQSEVLKDRPKYEKKDATKTPGAQFSYEKRERAPISTSHY